MSLKDNKDFIYLIWKDPESRIQYTVGQLFKNGQYEFKYTDDIEEAKEHGFEPLISFEDISKKYKSNILFPVFSSRLPDKKRKDINHILNKYGLTEYDEYCLLKKSGAKLPIDNLKFVEPLFGNEFNLCGEFYLAGVRHYMGCDSTDCDKADCLNINDKLSLVLEPENKYDKRAIKVLKSGKLLGYIPRYYNKNIRKLLIEKNSKYNCKIIEVNKDTDCDNCVKIRLEFNQL